jgi:RimJ/RimL family protein N-acetyltransferase
MKRVVRAIRAAAWRLLHDTEYVVFSAGPLVSRPSLPDGFTLVRLSRQDTMSLAAATAAMRAAEEPSVVEERLEHGDELFGWEQSGRIVSFGWICYQDRVIGLRRMPEDEHRVCLFNFHTQPEYRGRCLYPALLQQVRYTMGQEGRTQIIIDAHASNRASIRGIEKAGFSLVARMTVRTYLGHFSRELCGAGLQQNKERSESGWRPVDRIREGDA